MGNVPDLSHHLRALIGRQGPISVARFMELALGHPELGYYRRRDPLGLKGDFVTAPEVSQMFGELIGAWCAVVWSQMGRPDPLRLVELGPGRGTLMADALRVIRQTAPAFHQALRLHLVETSPVLKEKQAALLTDAAPSWHDTFGDVPMGPLLLIANEFFDALPVAQFERQADGWHERLVGEDGDGFRFVLSETTVPAPLDDGPAASVFETCDSGRRLAREIGGRLASAGGAALVIDYGHARPAFGDTLQAVRGHRYRPVLESPGEADLTAHVDFAALAAAARDAGAAAYGPIPQGEFLTRLGIGQRAERLSQGAGLAQAAEIVKACRRLIDRQEMGTLFKALAMTGPGQPAPPAFGATS